MCGAPGVDASTHQWPSISSGRPAKFRGPDAKRSSLAGLAVKKFNRAGMAKQ
jgi:hypothetical protein